MPRLLSIYRSIVFYGADPWIESCALWGFRVGGWRPRCAPGALAAVAFALPWVRLEYVAAEDGVRQIWGGEIR